MQRLLTGLLSPCLTAATQGWPWAGPTGSLARCPGQTDMQVGTHRAALLRQAAALPEGASCEGVGALSGNRAGTVILTWDLHCSEGGRAVGLRGLGKRRARDPAKEACVQALLQGVSWPNRRRTVCAWGVHVRRRRPAQWRGEAPGGWAAAEAALWFLDVGYCRAVGPARPSGPGIGGALIWAEIRHRSSWCKFGAGTTLVCFTTCKTTHVAGV